MTSSITLNKEPKHVSSRKTGELYQYLSSKIKPTIIMINIPLKILNAMYETGITINAVK